MICVPEIIAAAIIIIAIPEITAWLKAFSGIIIQTAVIKTAAVVADADAKIVAQPAVADAAVTNSAAVL